MNNRRPFKPGGGAGPLHSFSTPSLSGARPNPLAPPPTAAAAARGRNNMSSTASLQSDTDNSLRSNRVRFPEGSPGDSHSPPSSSQRGGGGTNGHSGNGPKPIRAQQQQQQQQQQFASHQQHGADHPHHLHHHHHHQHINIPSGLHHNNSSNHMNYDGGGNSESILTVMADIFTALLAHVCLAGLSTILVMLYVTVRPFSRQAYRRLAAQLGASSLIDAVALLLPNTKIVLTGDSDVPSALGTSIMVSNHFMDGDWWAILLLSRCIALRGSVKVILRNEYLHVNVDGTAFCGAAGNNNTNTNTNSNNTNGGNGGGGGGNYAEQKNQSLVPSAPQQQFQQLSSSLRASDNIHNMNGGGGAAGGGVGGGFHHSSAGGGANNNHASSVTSSTSTSPAGSSVNMHSNYPSHNGQHHSFNTNGGTFEYNGGGGHNYYNNGNNNTASNSTNNTNSNQHNGPQDLALMAKLLHLFLEFPLMNGDQDYMSNRNQMFQLLRSFADENLDGGASAPVHLLFFPEGWCLHSNSTDRQAILAKSNEFAQREGRPQLRHLLLPRARGFNVSLECLRESAPVVYDVTMAPKGYDGSLPPFVKLSTISLWNILRRKFPKEIHIRIKRYNMEDVMSDSSWLDTKWAEKDRLLSHFARFQSFPADSRGFRNPNRSFYSRQFSLESSTLALARLLILPFTVPLILLLSFPLFWTTLWIWLANKAFRFLVPDSFRGTRGEDSRHSSGLTSADQTPGSNPSGTPYVPATPFASPSVTTWREMLNNNTVAGAGNPPNT